MEKIIPAVFMAMVVSVISVLIAYVAGRYIAESSLRTEFNARWDEVRTEDAKAKADLRQELLQIQTNHAAEVAGLHQELELARSIQPPAETPEPVTQSVQPVEQPASVQAQQPDALLIEKPDALPTEEPQTPIDEEVFERIENEMSYLQVVEILGRDGILSLNLIDENGSVTQQFIWKWNAPDGSRGRIYLSFLNGSVQSKTFEE